MTVRAATEDDIAFLSDAYRHLVDHIRCRTRDPYFMQLESGYVQGLSQWFGKLIKHERVLVLVGCSGSETRVGFLIGVIGPCSLSLSRIKHVGEIIACWVEPSDRREGIASALVEQAEKWFASKGMRYVEIDYMVGNSEADAFWNQTEYKPCRVSSRKCLNPIDDEG